MNRDTYIGKYVLIGITFLDEAGKLIEQFQIYGPIVLIDEIRGIVIEKTDGSGEFSIPPGLQNLRPAPRGQYRLNQ